MVYSQPAAHLLVELSGIGQGVAKGDSAIIVACELYNNYQFSSSRRLIFFGRSDVQHGFTISVHSTLMMSCHHYGNFHISIFHPT